MSEIIIKPRIANNKTKKRQLEKFQKEVLEQTRKDLKEKCLNRNFENAAKPLYTKIHFTRWTKKEFEENGKYFSDYIRFNISV
ncbi:MAG: hypothetical protein ACRC6U_00555 [Fusobacteriaceae bacterium]